MVWVRLIQLLVATAALIVAPWLVAGRTSSLAVLDSETAERTSCCGEGGSCCCCPDDALPPACPCCPAPITPKPTNQPATPISIAAIEALARVARPRPQSQSTARDLRRELNARTVAQHDTHVALRSWNSPSSNVRLWTCVHQT